MTPTPTDALVIELQDVFDTGLAMRVVHQDETRIPRGSFEWKATNRTEILAISEPALKCGRLFVRGTTKMSDHEVSVRQFDNQCDRDVYRARLTEAVAELNRQLAPKRRVKGWYNVYQGPGGILAFGSVCPLADRASADARNLGRLGVVYIDAEVQP